MCIQDLIYTLCTTTLDPLFFQDIYTLTKTYCINNENHQKYTGNVAQFGINICELLTIFANDYRKKNVKNTWFSFFIRDIDVFFSRDVPLSGKSIILCWAKGGHVL